MKSRTRISRRTFLRWSLLSGAGILLGRSGVGISHAVWPRMPSGTVQWWDIRVFDLRSGRGVAHARVEITWRPDRWPDGDPEARLVTWTNTHGRVRVRIPETVRYRPELCWQIRVRRAPYFARIVWPGHGWGSMSLFRETALSAVQVSPLCLHVQIPVLSRGPSLPFCI